MAFCNRATSTRAFFTILQRCNFAMIVTAPFFRFEFAVVSDAQPGPQLPMCHRVHVRAVHSGWGQREHSSELRREQGREEACVLLLRNTAEMSAY